MLANHVTMGKVLHAPVPHSPWDYTEENQEKAPVSGMYTLQGPAWVTHIRQKTRMHWM